MVVRVRLRSFVLSLGSALALAVPALAQVTAVPPATGSTAPSAPEVALDLADLVRTALEHNAGLEAARHRLAAARLRPEQEKRLPDPMLSAGWNSSGNPLPGAGLGTEPTANIGLMVTQPLPYPGKRDLRAAVAGHEADAEASQLEALEHDVTSRVKQAYYRLSFAVSAAEVLERNKEVLDTLLRVTEERYAVGRAMQADVFKAQAELTALELKLERLRHQRIAREAELNALVDRHADQPVGRPAPLTLPDFTLSIDALLASAARTPVLGKSEALVARAGAAVESAKRDFKPDFAVSGGYYYMGSMPAMYMVRFDVALPVQRARRSAAVLEREASFQESRAGLEATRREVESSVQDDYHMAMTESRLARLYRDTMLPQQRLAFEASMAGYQTGAGDFGSLLAIFSGVLESEMSYLEALAEFHVAVSRLEALGGPVVH
jgi:outer membrane protein TolC